MAAKLQNYQDTVAGQLGSFPGGGRELHPGGGNPDDGRTFTKCNGSKLDGGILQQGLRLGDKAPNGSSIQDCGASISGDDAANTEAGCRGLHSQLVVAALQPSRKVRARGHKNVVGARAGRAPAVNGRGMEGWAILQEGLGEEIATHDVALHINAHQLGGQVQLVLGLQSCVIDTQHVVRGDLLWQCPAHRTQLSSRLRVGEQLAIHTASVAPPSTETHSAGTSRGRVAVEGMLEAIARLVG